MFCIFKGQKTHQRLPPGHHDDGQPLNLNWAGCDMFGGDLLDLDETDSELLDSKLLNTVEFPEDTNGDLFQNMNINKEPSDDMQLNWADVEETHQPITTNVPGNILSESPIMDQRPEYPPTLLELEVQALAKLGVIKLYYDSKDLEREAAKAEEDRRQQIINRYERDRHALSPVPGQRPQRVKMVHNSAVQTSGVSDLLELQKVALSNMKDNQKSSARAFDPTLSPVPLMGGSDVHKLQKLTVANMERANQSLGPTTDSLSNVEGGLLELQKVALVSMKRLSEVVESHTSNFVTGPELQSTATEDLLKLQEPDYRANIKQESQNKPSLSSGLSLKTTAPTKLPQQDGESDLLELQKVALRSMRSISKSSMPALRTEKAKGGGSDSSKLRKFAPESVTNEGAPVATPAVWTQPTLGDLSELQKLALRNIQPQKDPSTPPTHSERGVDLQDLQKKNLLRNPREVPPTQIRQQDGEGGDLLERQKEAWTRVSYGKDGEAQVNPDSKDRKQQFKAGGGGGTSSSSPPMFNKMSAKEPLDILLQELSLKDKTLQSASKTIEERDQRLQEYEASLANALNLLQCMNVRCTDAQEETSKVLTEVEEIFGNLNEACNAVEYFDCSIPQCAKHIHNLEGPSTCAPNSSHLGFGTKNGLGINQVEIDSEQRNLVEELLKELGNIDVARNEAQQGFELQIQRNEQLIAEMQQLDVASPVLDGVLDGARCDEDENSRDQGRGNQSEDGTSDQGKQNLFDQATKDPFDQAKAPVHENPSYQPKGDLCDHDQYKNPIDQANEMSGAYVDGNPLDQVDDPSNKDKEKPCDHVYESPRGQAQQTLGGHVFKNPLAQLDENSGDHAYKQPGDQCNENQCDHVYENTKHHSNESLLDEAHKNPFDHSYEQTNGDPCDHSYEQTNGDPCDHDFQDDFDLTSEIPPEIPFERPHDLDSKNSGLELKEDDIGSTSPSLADSLKEKSVVFAERQSMERTHQRKRPNRFTRVSSPNALWEHLRHFERKQARPFEVETTELVAERIKLQGDSDLKTRELESQLAHRTNEVSVLHHQMNEMRNALLQEQEKTQALSQKAIDIHPWPTKADMEQKDKVIRKMHLQMHQLEAALRQEREENREALAQKIHESSRPQAMVDQTLALPAMVDMDNLKAGLHSKDELIRELHDKIARMETAWQAEKHQLMKCIDDLETKQLVKEEEIIKLSHELETSRSSVYSQRPDELRFEGDHGTHFFHKQGKEEGREILDLRCEVLSLQDCLGIKTQAIKTMEKELARSYSIVTELRSKLRGLQEYERNSPKTGYNDLIGRLRNTEEKLQRSESERALMNRKIQDLSAKCNYFEELEHRHIEGFDEKKKQATKELEKELERNVQQIKNMQARCNEYEARAKRAEARNIFDPAGRSSDGGRHDLQQERDRTKLVKVSEENEALRAQCDQLRLEMVRYQEENKRKGKLFDELHHELQNLKVKKEIPGMYQQNDGKPRSPMVFNDGRPKSATTITQSTSSVLDLSKVESGDVNTLREMLRGQWRVQKVMEDRLNSMMAYVSDRVNEFEREPSDAASDSSFAATPELNHFHVEAKLMKLQLEQQLQVLRGTTFTSLPTSGVASPGQSPQNSVSTQNFQLLVEKTALEDSAQTLQEKTSRLLNKLTFMRTEFNSH